MVRTRKYEILYFNKKLNILANIYYIQELRDIARGSKKKLANELDTGWKNEALWEMI